jgi:hypothetical protein
VCVIFFMNSDRVMESAIRTAQNLLWQNLPPAHNLRDAATVTRVCDLVRSPAIQSALERSSDTFMVIGYSFSDAHINDAIMDAIKESDLKIFLIDPLGDKILDKRDPRAMIPDHPGPLLESVPPPLIGISRCPIASQRSTTTSSSTAT